MSAFITVVVIVGLVPVVAVLLWVGFRAKPYDPWQQRSRQIEAMKQDAMDEITRRRRYAQDQLRRLTRWQG